MDTIWISHSFVGGGRRYNINARNLRNWKAAALKFTNEIREALGKPAIAELQRGNIEEPRECVIANSLSADGLYPRVDYNYVEILGTNMDRSEREFAVPAMVVRFLKAFDSGYYPELRNDLVFDLDDDDKENFDE